MTNFPTSDVEIRALRVRVLRALGAAAHPKESIGIVAANHQLTVEDVRSLVDKHGYPDPKEMRRHAFELDTNGSVPPARPAPSAVPQQPAQALIIERLLGAGEKSAKARTRNLAKKIRGNVAELHGLVVAERKEAEAATAAAEERVRLRAEVEELERQLAEKKAKLRPTTTTKKATDAPKNSAAEIRAWAATHSVACPAFGRLPGDVIEAFELANRQAS